MNEDAPRPAVSDGIAADAQTGTELDVPEEWHVLLDELAGTSWRRLVVLGARDRGKSSFCRVLSGALSSRGMQVGLLDTDLGQKLVGPLACVTLGRAAGDGCFSLDRFRFVGETNPAGSMAGVVASAARLAQAARCDRLIVNTSGLVSGPGLALKRWKIDALAPDWIIALTIGDELDAVLRPLPAGGTRRIAPSCSARPKSDAFRREGRALALGSALEGAEWRMLRGVAAEDLQRTPPPAGSVRLCGLSDDEREDLGIGVLGASPTGSGPDLAVLTAVDPIRVARVRLGMAMPEGLLDRLPARIQTPARDIRAMCGNDEAGW
jgi:polynucleotide 5'-hydroxyl-kinase GRC3/NOL9